MSPSSRRRALGGVSCLVLAVTPLLVLLLILLEGSDLFTFRMGGPMPPLIRAEGALDDRLRLTASEDEVVREVSMFVPAGALPEGVTGADVVHFEADVTVTSPTASAEPHVTIMVHDPDGAMLVPAQAVEPGADVLWEVRCQPAVDCERTLRFVFAHARREAATPVEVEWRLKAQIRYPRGTDDLPGGLVVDLDLVGDAGTGAN